MKIIITVNIISMSYLETYSQTYLLMREYTKMSYSMSVVWSAFVIVFFFLPTFAPVQNKGR